MEDKLRVHIGALCLDSIRPNWANEVNLDTLDQSSVTECLLGQLYGDFRTGSHAVFLEEWEYDQHDRLFAATLAGKFGFVGSELLEYWYVEIKRRRK